MKKNIFIMAVIFLVVINISSLATIGYHRWCRYRENCHFLKSQTNAKDLYARLSLSSDQIARMNGVRESLAAEMEKTESALHKEKAALMDVFEDSPTDEDRIQIVHLHIDSLQARLQGIVIKSILKEKEILTHDQKRLYFSIIRERLCGYAIERQAGGLNTPADGKTEAQCPGRVNKDITLKGGEWE